MIMAIRTTPVRGGDAASPMTWHVASQSAALRQDMLNEERGHDGLGHRR
jgi:hypothetical protein